jgi:hypothetical protein
MVAGPNPGSLSFRKEPQAQSSKLKKAPKQKLQGGVLVRRSRYAGGRPGAVIPVAVLHWNFKVGASFEL